MTLHEAILETLIQLNNSATTREIADHINETGIYQRGDRTALSASQVRARIGNYPQLFDISEDNRVSAIKNSINVIENVLPLALLNILRSRNLDNSTNADLLICTYLLYFRKRNNFNLIPERHRGDIFRFLDELDLKKDELNLIEITFNATLQRGVSNRIFNLISSSNVHQLSSQEFRNLYRNWLNVIGKTQISSGHFNTPEKINNIICSLLDNKRIYQTVFDPFAGICTTVSSLNQVLNNNTNFYLQDISIKSVILGKLNLLANDVHGFNYVIKDSIRNRFSETYDLITTTPPLGLKVNLNEIDPLENSSLMDGSKPLEYVLMDKVVHSLNIEGQGIIVVPESFLFNSQAQLIAFRRQLVQKGLISKIISIPANAFQPYSGVKTSIVVIDKKNAALRNEIEFIELTKESFNSIPDSFAPDKVNLSNSTIVTSQTVLDQNCDLTVNRYNKTFKSEMIFESGKEYVKLETVLSQFNSYGNIDKVYLNDTDGIPFVGVKDLARPEAFPFLNLANINRFVEDSIEIRGRYQRNFVPQNAILISKVGINLYPTIYFNDQPILTNPNIFCFTAIGDRIDPLFLASELKQDYVRKQLDFVRKVVTIPSLSKKDLLSIKIWLPSVGEQKLIIIKRLSEFNIDTDIKHTTANQVFANEIISTFKHEFGNLKNPLITGIKNLKDFLNDRIDVENERISTRPDSRNIKQVLDGLDDIATEMGAIIDDMVDSLSSEKKRKKTNVIEFFSGLESKLCTNKCVIIIENSISRKDFFDIDSSLICKAFRNLIINAEKHGYSDEHQERNILFKVRKSEDSQYVVIDFINDGKAFIEGFTFKDYISFGKKSGSHSGSGIGGFLVNKIIQDHDGFFEEIDLENNLSETINGKDFIKGIHFLIQLPICND